MVSGHSCRASDGLRGEGAVVHDGDFPDAQVLHCAPLPRAGKAEETVHQEA